MRLIYLPELCTYLPLIQLNLLTSHVPLVNHQVPKQFDVEFCSHLAYVHSGVIDLNPPVIKPNIDQSAQYFV